MFDLRNISTTKIWRAFFALSLTFGGLTLVGVPLSGSLAGATSGESAPRATAVPNFTIIDVPGASATHVTWVNNSGVVAGYFLDASGQHGFIDANGTITVIDVPGSDTTEISSINDAGAVTGTFWNSANTVEHSFVRSGSGVFTWLDDPQATSGDQWGTVASDVNNAGVVVGYFFTTDLDGYTYPDNNIGAATGYEGFVWQDGTFTTYNVPGAPAGSLPDSGTQLLGINNSNVMVGTTVFLTGDVPPNEGFTDTGSTFTTFIDPSVPIGFCGWTTLNAINDLGSIAGNSGNGCAPTHSSWLMNGGQLTFINYPGSTETDVSSVNNSGLVAGTWTSSTGSQHGFTVNLALASGAGSSPTGPANAPAPTVGSIPASVFGAPTSVTASSTTSVTISGVSGAGSGTIWVPANALPVGTTVSVYPIVDSSTLAAMLPAGQTYLFALAVAWQAPDGTTPTSISPITMAITDASIASGDVVYQLTSTGLVAVGTSSIDGSASVTFSNDPVFVVAAKQNQASLNITSAKGTVGVALALTTTGGSGLGKLSYAVLSGTAQGCLVTGTSLSVTGAGTCVVTATKAADSTYLAASSGSTSITFTLPARPARLTINFGAKGSSLSAIERLALRTLAKKLLPGASLVVTSYARQSTALAKSRGQTVAKYLESLVSVHVIVKTNTKTALNEVTITTTSQ
jgi:hypothetical protein